MWEPKMPGGPIAHRIRRLSRLELPGGGQVVVRGDYAFIGHMHPPHGTTIVDVSDPRRPKVVASLELPDSFSHSHKVRVAGDLMIVNVEQARRHFMRKAEHIPGIRARWEAERGRPPTDAELAAELGVKETDIPVLEEAHRRGYRDGGFKVYDISDPSRPKLLAYQRTYGFGVHRFDMDERYAYISTEMEGYIGNILVIYDLSRPERPEEVSRWWMPGQYVAGGETPTWTGYSHRLHHALRAGAHLWAAVWYAGVRVIDISDITRPRTVGAYNYHPPFPEPTHTFMKVPFPVAGREIAVAVDEEHEHTPGQPHAGLWVFDVTDLENIQPLSMFHLSELQSPWSQVGRFGAHQFQEHMRDTLLYVAWFSGGLRIVDIADPLRPREVGSFIPEPASGEAGPQTNDVDVDELGLIYIVDRNKGFDILEFTG